ncbi:MAG: AAA family ATPase [Muribaculaceae bacterium]|nr:AAA family ATPase [Muribaculaceae bacterium]
MKLEHLDISNYRCFKKYSVDLFPGFNILIGRNGSGKSTLLHAIQKAISFIFSSDRSVSEDFLSAGMSNLNIRTFETPDFYFDSATRTLSKIASIRGVGSFAGHEINWTLYKRNADKASLYPSKYKDAFNIVMSQIENGADYPLLAYYSDSYPHRNTKQMQQALDRIKSDALPRNFGYYQWDDDSSCTAIWEKRLSDRLARMLPLYTPAMRLASEKLELSEMPETEETRKRLKEIHDRQAKLLELTDSLQQESDYIETKLKQFINLLPNVEGENYGLNYLSVESDNEGYHLLLNFENGKSSTISNLPAGYRRLISIVLDLAYRSYILNDHNESSGIVIIDEIDLHLHPSLEGCVVNAFRQCFPSIQFIVSTHSVAVISNIASAEENPDNRVFILKDGVEQPELLNNLNGIDYDIVLRDFMDTYSKNEDIKSLIDKCLTFYSYKMAEEGMTIYNQIVDAVGRDSEVIKELDKKISNYNV